MRQRMRSVLVACLAGSLALGVLASSGAMAGGTASVGLDFTGDLARDRTDEPRRVAPLLVETGRVSEIGEQRFYRAFNQQMFDRIWSAHMGDRVTKAVQGWPMTPQVNFDRCEVVMLFAGGRANSNGLRIVETVEGDDLLTIRYESISFQTAGRGADGGVVRSRPWAMVLIERSGKAIEIQENTQNIIGADPIWTTRVVLDDLKGDR